MRIPCGVSRRCRRLAPGDTPVSGCPDVIESVRAVAGAAEEVDRIADHFRSVGAAWGKQRVVGRHSRGHLIPGEPVVGRPPHLVGTFGRRRAPADHVQIAVQHRRSVVPARAEVVGNRKTVARGLALIGGLDRYGLGPVGVHLVKGRLAEGDFTGGFIYGNLVGETGGLTGDAVGGPCGNRGAVGPQRVGIGLVGIAVGADQQFGSAHGSILEGKPHCR